jgi:hypothetical protein
VRGERVSKASLQVDVVLVSARYDQGTRELDFAQGYVRRGKVWSDQLLLSRETVLDYVTRGKRVVTGQPEGVPGEFRQGQRIEAGGNGEGRMLRSVGAPGPGDNLGLPLV